MPAASRVLAEFTSDLICFSSEQYESRSVDQRIIALESIIDVLSLSYPGDLATAHVTSVERLFSHREGGVGGRKSR